jgi:hypothetical protein
MRIDHLAVVVADLAVGVAHVEGVLGCRLRGGGKHAAFGTHNRLIRLGPGEYLEVIAPDPAAPDPGRPRWFGLSDAPAVPRLGNWIAEVEEMEAALALAPAEVGEALSLGRDDLRWRLTVPADGSLPFDAGYPTLIDWQAGRHPSDRLPDDGLELMALEIHHPQALRLSEMVSTRLSDPRVTYHAADAPSLRARIATPRGDVWL